MVSKKELEKCIQEKMPKKGSTELKGKGTYLKKRAEVMKQCSTKKEKWIRWEDLTLEQQNLLSDLGYASGKHHSSYLPLISVVEPSKRTEWLKRELAEHHFPVRQAIPAMIRHEAHEGSEGWKWSEPVPGAKAPQNETHDEMMKRFKGLLATIDGEITEFNKEYDEIQKMQIYPIIKDPVTMEPKLKKSVEKAIKMGEKARDLLHYVREQIYLQSVEPHFDYRANRDNETIDDIDKKVEDLKDVMDSIS